MGFGDGIFGEKRNLGCLSSIESLVYVRFGGGGVHGCDDLSMNGVGQACDAPVLIISFELCMENGCEDSEDSS